MKSLYVFFFCSSLLLFVGCNNDRNASSEEEMTPIALVQTNEQSPFNAIKWPVTLDTFKSNLVQKGPSAFTITRKPKNKFAISKDKDSITVSASFCFAYEDKKHKKAYSNYHFYIKTGMKYLNAYFRKDIVSNEQDDCVQKVVSAENGYRFDWSKKG